jgi:hypothetical protein
MSVDPGQDGAEIMERLGFGRGWPAHDDDFDPQRARRFNLGVGRAPAAVLRHQSFDALAFHEREFVRDRERPARKDQLVIRQDVDFGRPVYRSRDVAVLRRARERGELQPALSKKNRPPLSPENCNGVVDGRDFDPAVVGFARPRLTGEHDKRRTGRVTGGRRVCRHAGSEGVCGVDNGVDVLTCEKRRQALGAAKAADSPRYWRWSRIGRRAREGQDRLNLGLIGDLPRERAGFRRPAENEQAKAVQWAAP